MNKLIQFANKNKLSMTTDVDHIKDDTIVNIKFYNPNVEDVQLPALTIQLKPDEEFDEDAVITFLNENKVPDIANRLWDMEALDRQIAKKEAIRREKLTPKPKAKPQETTETETSSPQEKLFA